MQLSGSIQLRRDIQVAIDGPSAAGKTTLARELATAFSLTHIDSGALYRAYALAAMRLNVSALDGEIMEKLVNSVRVVVGDTVTLDGEDVTLAIRDPEVSEITSIAATDPGFRKHMVNLLRFFAADHPALVMDGRDIGTVVLPRADLKIYLDASPQERIRRRLLQSPTRRSQVDRDVLVRDVRDLSRNADPLKIADDAFVIDSTDLSVQDVLSRVAREIRSRLADI